MAGAVFLGVEIGSGEDSETDTNRLLQQDQFPPRRSLVTVDEAAAKGMPLSVGLVGNCAEILPELVRRGFTPDLLTDQTSAHDPLNGYIPAGMSLADRPLCDPASQASTCVAAWSRSQTHVRAYVGLTGFAAAVTFDYGNNIRGQALKAGVKKRSRFSRFRP